MSPWTAGQRPTFPDQPPSGEPPAGGSPGMQHPAYNPNGVEPGPLVARGLEAFSRRYGQRWVFDADTSLWRWSVVPSIFDLRPGLQAYGTAGGKVNPTPINHEGALGLNIFYNVQFFPTSGATAPAGIPKIRCEYWEEGNVSTPDELYILGRVYDVTDTFLAGGLTIGTLLGSSVISIQPCMTPIRFWRPTVRLTIPGAADVLPTASLNAWAALH